MVSRARNFASFAKSMEDKTFVGSSISGTTTKTGTINIPLDTEDFTDYQIGQSSTTGKMVDPTTGNVTLTIPQANEANKKFTLHFQVGYDNSETALKHHVNLTNSSLQTGNIYSSPQPSTWPSGIQGGSFNNTGTRFFWVESTRDSMYWADLSSPYDIKSMIVPPEAGPILDGTFQTYHRFYNATTTTYNGNNTETVPMSFVWKPDGTEFFIMGGGNDSVQGWAMPSGQEFGDIRNANQSTYFRFFGFESSPSDIRFKPDGTRFFVSGFAGNTVDVFDMSTAWDLTTSSHVGTFRNSVVGDCRFIMFFDNGTTLFHLNEDQKQLNVYDLETAWDISNTSIPANSHFDRLILSVPQTSQNNIIWAAEMDYDGIVFGNSTSDFVTAFRGITYTLTLPASVKDGLPVLNRTHRYQIDLSSNNANSGSAEWYITDIRSVRV